MIYNIFQLWIQKEISFKCRRKKWNKNKFYFSPCWSVNKFLFECTFSYLFSLIHLLQNYTNTCLAQESGTLQWRFSLSGYTDFLGEKLNIHSKTLENDLRKSQWDDSVMALNLLKNFLQLSFLDCKECSITLSEV